MANKLEERQMSKPIFNENMSSDEARTVLFKAVENKTKEEIEELKREYNKVLPAILERENEFTKGSWVM